MISIELEGDDLIKDGELVRLGRLARAIAKGLGVSNSLNSERKIFPRINAAVQSGALNPIDPETLEPLSKNDYGNGLVHFDELAEWGRSTKQFDFRICAPASQKVVAGETATTQSLTEIRIAAILETATQLNYDPLYVTTGGKAIIKAECLDKLKGAPHRFTADTFKKAWQAARNAGLVEVENVKMYRGQ